MIIIIQINSNIQEINHKIHQILVRNHKIKILINSNIQEINHRILKILVQLILDWTEKEKINKDHHILRDLVLTPMIIQINSNI